MLRHGVPGCRKKRIQISVMSKLDQELPLTVAFSEGPMAYALRLLHCYCVFCEDGLAYCRFT